MFLTRRFRPATSYLSSTFARRVSGLLGPRLQLRFTLVMALGLPTPGHAGDTVTLEDLIVSTLRTHPAVQAQRAQQDASQAEVNAARWQFFPTPRVSVEKAGTAQGDLTYLGDKHVTTLSLQQPLWTGGRLTAQKERAEADVLVSQGALDETRQQLALRVVQAYSDWLSAHLKLQASEASMASHTRLRDLVRRRLDEGASSQSDLVLAVSRLQSVAAEMALERSQQDIALARLSQLVGQRIDAVSLADRIAAPRPLSADLPTLLRLAQAADPTSQKLEAQARRQETMIAEQRAALSPEVYVRAERQFGNYSLRNAPPENRIFIGLSSNFGAGMSTLSNIAGARAQYQAALADVDVQQRAVGEQVMSDYALVSSAQTRLEALDASLASADEVAKSYDRQYLAGHKSWLDVMNSARELDQTRAQIADLRSAQLVATWRLAILTTAALPDKGSHP